MQISSHWGTTAFPTYHKLILLRETAIQTNGKFQPSWVKMTKNFLIPQYN